jgi:hypothetical protein
MKAAMLCQKLQGVILACNTRYKLKTYVHRSSSLASVYIARISGSLAEILLKSISVLLELQ